MYRYEIYMNSEEQTHMRQLAEENFDLFHLPGDYLGKTTAVEHEIPTTDSVLINVKQYRYPPMHKEEIDKQMKELLENDILKPSKSPYNRPLWIVPKKLDAQGNKMFKNYNNSYRYKNCKYFSVIPIFIGIKHPSSVER